MCVFGGGGGAPSYIPAPPPVQARMADSVDANKSVADSEDKIKKQIAASSSMKTNTKTSPGGLTDQAPVYNKSLAAGQPVMNKTHLGE